MAGPGSSGILFLPAYGVHDGIQIVECSPDLAALLGYDDPATVVGRSPLDVIDPASQDETIRRTLSPEGDRGAYESVGVHADGSKFAIEIACETVRYKSHPARLVLVRDLSPVALVVDDEAVVCNMVAALLQSFGYRAVTATSGTAALAMFVPEKFAVVTTDVVMPGMTGVELGRQLRALDSGIPILYMSGFTTEELPDDESTARLKKPFGISELKASLDRLPARATERLMT